MAINESAFSPSTNSPRVATRAAEKAETRTLNRASASKLPRQQSGVTAIHPQPLQTPQELGMILLHVYTELSESISCSV